MRSNVKSGDQFITQPPMRGFKSFFEVMMEEVQGDGWWGGGGAVG